MDNKPSYREQRHRGRHQEQRRRKHQERRQGWKFTYFGGTPEKRSEAGNWATFSPELTQNASRLKSVFPLSTSQVGDCVVISQILSGESIVLRLSNRGLTLGSEVRVISKTRSGSVIISIQDEQIGLGADMAKGAFRNNIIV